jgi:hypothetical protein
MRRPALLAISVGAILLVAACGGTAPPAASGPGAGTPAAVITPGPGGGVATGTECAAIPTFSLANPNPSFPPDTALVAKFPAAIGGSPATDDETAPFGAILCLGGQQPYNQAVAGLPGTCNWSTVSFGSATYELDDAEFELFAFRTPGGDARSFVVALVALSAQSGQQFEGTMSQGNVGGKNALIVTQTDGSKDYGYVSGDTLFFIESGATEAQAATILAALP